MLDENFSETAVPGSFEDKLYRTSRKMLGTLYNYFQQHFHSVHLIVSPHEEGAGADMTAYFEYAGHVRVFERTGEFRIQHPDDPKQRITFNITDEKVANQYNVLQAGVNDLRDAFGDAVAMPNHIYMSFDGESKTAHNELEYLHLDAEVDHSAAAAKWLVELESGEKIFFRNMLKEFDMGL